MLYYDKSIFGHYSILTKYKHRWLQKHNILSFAYFCKIPYDGKSYYSNLLYNKFYLRHFSWKKYYREKTIWISVWERDKEREGERLHYYKDERYMINWVILQDIYWFWFRSFHSFVDVKWIGWRILLSMSWYASVMLNLRHYP